MVRFGVAILIMMLPTLNSCLHRETGLNMKAPALTKLLDRGLQSGHFESKPSATWISDMSHLERIYARMGKSTLFDVRGNSPTPDFSREGVLLVEMGQKSTGGYRLDLIEGLSSIAEGTAEVTLSWIEPPPGTILPQVITSPWILITLSRGDYSLINVLDQDGQLRLELIVK